MPIYEFACPRCRVIFSFLSKRLPPSRGPACPKCGHKNLTKQVSAFAMPRGLKEPATSAAEGPETGPMPDLDDPRIASVMNELEQNMDHLDENNPRHMAYMMKKMKDILPPGTVPKEMDVAIKRLEAGEDPEKIEADMGDAFKDFMGGPEGEEGMEGSGGNASYTRDAGLYEY